MYLHLSAHFAIEGVQPDVRHVRGMEGILSAGELIYLPVAWSQPDML